MMPGPGAWQTPGFLVEVDMLYQDNGYISIDHIINNGMTYNFVVGGRGTGKTYTALKWMLDHTEKFVYMRRTQVQLDNVCTPELSPLKPINADDGRMVLPFSAGKNSYVFKDCHMEGDEVVQGEIMGYAIALSTVSNLRGFSVPEVKYLIYDEFIPEKHERPLREECTAFLNCIETINRNRELLNAPPLKVMCLANANDFANPLFVGLGIVKIVEKMIKTDREEYLNPQRSIGLYMLQHSPISHQKSDTSLYKMVGDDTYTRMALSNIFVDYDDINIQSMPLQEYSPIIRIGELTIYQHKAIRRLYVSSHRSGTVPEYPPTDDGCKRFKLNHKAIVIAIMLGRCVYESHFDKSLMLKYLTMGGK